jgi:hypothetical protein
MLELRNLEELALFDETVKGVIDYEYEVTEEGGYDVIVPREQLKECVELLVELMRQTDRDDIDPWDNKEYNLAMRLYDEAYYDMCYGDGRLADAYAEDDYE